ncbi:hypothetical protein Poli38472_002807 [Pythium oligandrum]|uniref:Uncharacterized protein n=1 Tax=Pythium oligandrum TaxID=41045 RepID=A0A8K1FEQ3_PYTOL|nr:hypothetical protein Poli38472_002807 [Pythium oligandrum]|eukprot:TMW56882.1 hypothetical protein Poli38472_002807 [Pythium oligandrum]
MIVYGGFSALCEDYCNDMWLYDFSDNEWTEMMEIGNTAYGPGKRFKFSSVVRDFKMYVFGGFRLWHGFAHENSIDNDWNDVSQYPRGGYLNDLWVYDKISNTWSNLTEKVVCPELTVLQILENIDVECVLKWPSSRAGHAAVSYQDAIYIHAGYRTFFPYPTTTSAGAGRGTLTIRGTGFTPYPTHPYYLNDLWKFNLTTGIWEELSAKPGDTQDKRTTKLPPPRLDHTLVVAKDVFLLFGGYLSNYYYDDTWQYNITFNRWRKLSTFVHALYPTTCTDDLAVRKLEHSGNYKTFAPPADLPDDLGGYYFIKERHYGTLKYMQNQQEGLENHLCSFSKLVVKLQGGMAAVIDKMGELTFLRSSSGLAHHNEQATWLLTIQHLMSYSSMGVMASLVNRSIKSRGR